MYATLVSDSDGVIVNKFVETGEVVAAGQPVFRIAENGAYDAVFDMPENLLDVVLPGRTMEVCLDRLKNICSEAEIYEVSPEADSATRTYQTKAIVKQASQMPLGTTVVGRVVLPKNRVIIIPSAAVVSHDGQAAVWVIDDATGKIAARPIEVRQYTTSAVVVARGLSAGEKIVTAGAQALRQGQKVKDIASDEAH